MSITSTVNPLIQPLGEMPPDTIVFGRTEAMQAVRDRLGKLAGANVPVLIQGESGTGKDIIARMIHANSPWRTGPWVKVNCPAIPGTLLESELFGYEKGAFTGAYGTKPGRVEMAHRGTLFLDEIAEMHLETQAKLLRVIEDKRVRPIGATEETPVDVRIVAATNSDLEELMARGRFRSDLYYRLATFTLAVPPLRERPEDIPLLVKRLLSRASAEAGKALPELEPDAMTCLMRYRWPGNIRELQNAIQRAIILCRDNTLTTKDLPLKVAGTDTSPRRAIEEAVDRRLSLDLLEREYVRAVLESVNGNKREAAAILQIDRKTLYRKLEEPEPAEQLPPSIKAD